ncbi:MAG: hypothetical protein PHS41_11935, partial [Victivallaceae bacterium]|nr:hypothetical protein [Victivallaceae bacterium]
RAREINKENMFNAFYFEKSKESPFCLQKSFAPDKKRKIEAKKKAVQSGQSIKKPTLYDLTYNI